MKIVFVSNYLNHHQRLLCEQFIKRCSSFCFIECEPTQVQGYQERIDAPYVVQYNNSCDSIVREIIKEADVVIFGGCPNELIELRMKENKLSFLYSERFFKKGTWRRFIPRTRKKVIERVAKYAEANLYVLCASAYLKKDLSYFAFPERKCLKWGYFPETRHYDLDRLMKKNASKVQLFWAGRMLDWKHPDDAIFVAKYLKDKGYDFHLQMIGDGEMMPQIKENLQTNCLSDVVTLFGSLTPEQVREKMEQSNIFLFTSDYQEGWGAVLNEAMNSGCAVVASHAIGSVPYLLKHNKNGLIYRSGDVDGLYESVKYLMDTPGEQERLGKAAYETITGLWNAEVAAERLINLSEHLLAGEKYPDLYRTGPCSRAEIIKDDWFYE